MNAAHISNAITAMEESLQFLKQIPYKDREFLDRLLQVTGKLAWSTSQMKSELSKINLEITS
jgi:hypothetical protein